MHAACFSSPLTTPGASWLPAPAPAPPPGRSARAPGPASAQAAQPTAQRAARCRGTQRPCLCSMQRGAVGACSQCFFIPWRERKARSSRASACMHACGRARTRQQRERAPGLVHAPPERSARVVEVRAQAAAHQRLHQQHGDHRQAQRAVAAVHARQLGWAPAVADEDDDDAGDRDCRRTDVERLVCPEPGGRQLALGTAAGDACTAASVTRTVSAGIPSKAADGSGGHAARFAATPRSTPSSPARRRPRATCVARPAPPQG